MPEMTWHQAIVKVLEDRGEPMRYRAITEEIIRAGLRTNVGATPSDTVSSTITTNINELDKESPFVRVSRGVYGLRSWQDGPETAAVDAAIPDSVVETRGLCVRAFGMFWDRDQVDWTQPTPVLFGQEFDGTQKVNFSDQRGIYVLHDRHDIVYVGRVLDRGLGVRLREHTRGRLKTRWDRFSWFGFQGVTSDGRLLEIEDLKADLATMVAQLEAVLIELVEPPQNRQQGEGLVGIEYLQVPDPSINERRIKAALNELLESSQRNR